MQQDFEMIDYNLDIHFSFVHSYAIVYDDRDWKIECRI